MAEIITVPDLGFDAAGGVLANWLKEVGESVAVGELVAEIESDKVTLEVEASVAGVVLEQLIRPGESVTVGTPIAKVGAAHELSTSPPPMTSDQGPVATEIPTPQTTAVRSDWPQATGDRPLPLATPIAQRMAQAHGLDLTQVAGSGPGGRILRGDVENHLSQSAPTAMVNDQRPLTTARPQAIDHRLQAPEQLSSLRRLIAQRMTESKQTIPHFYITISITMDDALALREQINAALSADGGPVGLPHHTADAGVANVTVNDLVMKATALALRDFPNLNASYVDDHIVCHPEINVGAAVAVEGGLLTVVNRRTDQRTITDIAHSNRAMIQRARTGKVKPEDVTGSTFTISNLGAYNTDHFAPIINPPQVAILGVATAKATPVVVTDQVVVRTIMQVTLSADHRVTDGVESTQFLHRVRELLESPLQVLI